MCMCKLSLKNRRLAESLFYNQGCKERLTWSLVGRQKKWIRWGPSQGTQRERGYDELRDPSEEWGDRATYWASPSWGLTRKMSPLAGLNIGETYPRAIGNQESARESPGQYLLTPGDQVEEMDWKHCRALASFPSPPPATAAGSLLQHSLHQGEGWHCEGRKACPWGWRERDAFTPDPASGRARMATTGGMWKWAAAAWSWPGPSLRWLLAAGPLRSAALTGASLLPPGMHAPERRPRAHGTWPHRRRGPRGEHPRQRIGNCLGPWLDGWDLAAPLPTQGTHSSP